MLVYGIACVAGPRHQRASSEAEKPLSDNDSAM